MIYNYFIVVILKLFLIIIICYFAYNPSKNVLYSKKENIFLSTIQINIELMFFMFH